MFPIRDSRGRIIAFGGRVLGDDKPKYLNSPETPVFHKGQELYGLYEARQKNRDLDEIMVVEGYMEMCIRDRLHLFGGQAAVIGIDIAAEDVGEATAFGDDAIVVGQDAVHRARELGDGAHHLSLIHI